MSNFMRRFLKNTSSLRLITSIKPQFRQKPFLSPFPRPTPNYIEQNPDPFFDPVINVNAKSGDPFKFFASFPFGYSLDPILLPGSGRSEVTESEDSVSEDTGTVYADSVKKKRKKKMNKHKYKKLRKRLRRKT